MASLRVLSADEGCEVDVTESPGVTDDARVVGGGGGWGGKVGGEVEVWLGI